MDEFSEEESINEEDYEDQLEYVELEAKKENIQDKKQLYMENDYSEQLESPLKEDNQDDSENESEFQLKKQSRTNRASKRPIQRSREPLDIEPVDDKKLLVDSSQSESVEIDDPW